MYSLMIDKQIIQILVAVQFGEFNELNWQNVLAKITFIVVFLYNRCNVCTTQTTAIFLIGFSVVSNY